jgi:acetyl esterase/lipase
VNAVQDAEAARAAVQSRLDPELARSLEGIPEGMDPAESIADPNVLAMMRDTRVLLEASGAALPVDARVSVVDRMIDGPAGPGALGVRVYTPRDAQGPMPAVLFSHGGAFVLGDLYSEEHRCLTYAAEARCVVVSVAWRHAPEHPYPAGVEDAYAALAWTVAEAGALGVDALRVAVAGASSGGAFAAALSLMARDRGGPAIAFQLLVYPVTDDRLVSPSMREFTASPLWTRGSSEQMWRHYLGEGRGPAPAYAAPGRAEDLSGLPPAYVMVAELDPLRDEAIEYAGRLLAAGVPVELHCFPGAFHGFDIVAPRSELGRRALAEQVGALERVFAA